MAFERILAAFRTAAWQHETTATAPLPARDLAAAQRPSIPPDRLTCPVTGPERTAFFAALRRKANQRAAEHG
jgi:hypothetical protein